MTIYKRGHIPSILLEDRKKFRKFDDDLVRYLNEEQIIIDSIFNKGGGISDNLDGEIISYTSNSTPSAEDAIAHTLKRIPIGYIIVRKNQNAHLYDGTTPFTDQNIYLISDTASVDFTIFVF